MMNEEEFYLKGIGKDKEKEEGKIVRRLFVLSNRKGLKDRDDVKEGKAIGECGGWGRKK